MNNTPSTTKQPTSATVITAVASVALAVTLALTFAAPAKVGTTNSYFSTYAAAKGEVPVSLSEQTSITETVDNANQTKNVAISNSKDSTVAVYVRAKAYAPEGYDLAYLSEDGKWALNESDGYFYYSDILYPDGTTSTFKVTFKGAPGAPTSQLPAPEEGDNFNIAVIYETTPVRFDDAGNPYANWNMKLNNDNLTREETTGGDQ